MFDVKIVHDEIIDWIRNSLFGKSGKPIVIGISGGKDSTICAALLAEALGKDRVIGIMMPNGVQKDITDSYRVVNFLGIKYYVVNIEDAYKGLTKEISKNFSSETSLYTTNTPARLRMTALYGVAACVGGFVVNTCNLSESIVGWETYGGDGFGDFSILGRLTKTEVVMLGDYMGLPKELVYKIPSDGMCGASDEDKMGFTYGELDSTIRTNMVGENFEKILEMNKRSHFKHENIRMPTYNPMLKINENFNWD